MTASIDRARPDPVESATMRTVTRRLVPILVVVWFICYLDRINIGFAAFGLEHTFGMTAAQYGLAAGIFYIGYVLVEVPSNILMVKVGARVWLTRIVVSWGIVLTVMAFAWNIDVLYVLRFLLGVAEAGLLPGILLYVAHWFPNKQRTKVIAIVMLAVPVATAFGGLLNGWILTAFDGALGLEGWRWTFLIGGAGSIPFGLLLFVLISDKPADAAWLRPEQRAWLAGKLADEDSERAVTAPGSHRAALRDKKVLTLSLIYFFVLCGSYPLTYWMPSAIKAVAKGLSSLQVGWLTAIPFTIAAVALYLVGRYVKTEHSARPVLIGLGASAVTFVSTALTLGSIPALAFTTVVLATVGTMTAKSLFWALPPAFLAGAGAASGIALINSVGATAGFISPYLVGWIQDASGGSVALSLSVMVLANLGAIVSILVLLNTARRQRRASAAKLTPSASRTRPPRSRPPRGSRRSGSAARPSRLPGAPPERG